jgi:hypothetical protein
MLHIYAELAQKATRLELLLPADVRMPAATHALRSDTLTSAVTQVLVIAARVVHTAPVTTLAASAMRLRFTRRWNLIYGRSWAALTSSLPFSPMPANANVEPDGKLLTSLALDRARPSVIVQRHIGKIAIGNKDATGLVTSDHPSLDVHGD